VIPAHAEHAVGHHERALTLRVGRLCERGLERGQVQMRVDIPLGGPRQTDRVDDAVVIELVADHRGLFGDQRRKDAHHGGVGRAPDHGGRPLVEARELALELDVRLPGTADEADSAGSGAVATGSRLLGRNDGRLARHPEVAVRIHAQEGARALAGDAVARTPPFGGRDDFGEDGLPALARPRRLELGELGR
jgi:hypothetical protein